jgi:hypothetical protein
MKFLTHAALGVSLAFAAPAFAATPAPAAQGAAVPAAAHVKAVQDLLGVMHTEYVLRGVAGRTRFPSEAQRKAVFARLDKMPPAEVYQRMAPPLARVISLDTAVEMTRFYNTPYGKQVIHNKFNSGPGLMLPGAKAAVPPEEKKERKRAAYVVASKELADAEPAVQSEAFKLLQAISKETR